MQFTIDCGLQFRSSSSSLLSAFSDADWAGVLKNSRPFLGLAQNLNIKLLPMLQLRLSGCSRCYESLGLFKPNLQCYGVTTLELRICHLTQSSMQGQSILKSTFTLFVSVLLRSNCRSVSSRPRIKLLISSPSHSRIQHFDGVSAISTC